MLLDEDPATVSIISDRCQSPPLTLKSQQLIRHTIGNFNIQPDKLALGRINESLSALQQARDLRIREAESALKSKTHHQSAQSNVSTPKSNEPPLYYRTLPQPQHPRLAP